MKPHSIFLPRLFLVIAMAAVLVSPGFYLGLDGAATLISEGGADGYEDISVEEAWDLLNDTTNGIQIPIDVRSTSEWDSERIDTPYPEFPHHFSLSSLSSQEGMEECKSRFEGETVVVYCRSGGRSASAAQMLVDQGFEGTVYNMEGGILAWQSAGYPTKMGDGPPASPKKPEGPDDVHAGYAVTYITAADDPDDDPVRYGWDWDGDGKTDEWTSYYRSGMTAAVSHTWAEAGSYQVRVKGEDNGGDESDLSSMLVVTVDDEDNTPPGEPVIDGPSQGKAGESYEFSFIATDPDDDQVYIWVEWGGTCPAVQWRGPYDSGEMVTLTNTWNETGTYTVQAKAKDIYDEESDWGTLEVTMPLRHSYRDIWDVWRYITAWFADITGMELLPPL